METPVSVPLVVFLMNFQVTGRESDINDWKMPTIDRISLCVSSLSGHLVAAFYQLIDDSASRHGGSFKSFPIS